MIFCKLMAGQGDRVFRFLKLILTFTRLAVFGCMLSPLIISVTATSLLTTSVIITIASNILIPSLAKSERAEKWL